MLSPVAALLGPAAFVVSESFLRRATEFLNDLTSAGLLLVVMFFVWFHFERYPNRWWLLAVAPAASAAYYLRYGTTLGLVVIAVVAGAIWFRRLAESRRQLMATAALLVALFIPHFWYSQRLTGSFLGVFRAARTAVGGGGGGLADYAEWFPEHLAGEYMTARAGNPVVGEFWKFDKYPHAVFVIKSGALTQVLSWSKDRR